jgi:hypothetical protein
MDYLQSKIENLGGLRTNRNQAILGLAKLRESIFYEKVPGQGWPGYN